MQAGIIVSANRVNEAIIDIHSSKKLLTIQAKATEISIRVKSLPCFSTPDVV